MTRCKMCESSLEGQHIAVHSHSPFKPGDRIPKEGEPRYEEDHAFVECPGCGREISVSPKDIREEPAWI